MGHVPAGGRLLWSCVFPLKAGSGVLPEALLHLPQKQQFTPTVFLEKKIVTLDNVTVTPDEGGCGRISLGEKSGVTAGEPFSGWQQYHQPWDVTAALERVRAATPGPLDLDVELQEEVVLPDWQVGKAQEREEGQAAYPITAGALTLEAVVPAADEGKALERWRKLDRRPPLYGLLHYEKCRLVLQPLAVLGADGPEQMMLSAEKVDRSTLLKALKF
jgi:hypothetical protein